MLLQSWRRFHVAGVHDHSDAAAGRTYIMNPSSTWQVFTITVTQLQGGGGAKTELSADLNLVDLAGSERAVSSGAQVCCCCGVCCCGGAVGISPARLPCGALGCCGTLLLCYAGLLL